MTHRIFRRILKLIFPFFITFCFYIIFKLFMKVDEYDEPFKTFAIFYGFFSILLFLYGTRLYLKVFFYI